MSDIILTGHAGEWSNISDRGINIAEWVGGMPPAAEKVTGKIITGVSGGPEGQTCIAYTVDRAGNVECVTDGWEPVVEDGWLTRFREVAHA